MITGPKDHVNAKPVVFAAWQRVFGREPTPKEQLYAQAIAALETGYGRIGQFADMAKRGLFNWGGLQRPLNSDGTCPTGYAPGKDQGNVCFQVFPSDEEAAARFVWEIAKSPKRPDVLAAMQGTADDVARAMRGSDLGKPPEQNHTAYYEGKRGTPEEDRIKIYGTLIRNNAYDIASKLQLAAQVAKQTVEEHPIATGSGGLVLLGLLGAGGFGLYTYMKGKEHG